MRRLLPLVVLLPVALAAWADRDHERARDLLQSGAVLPLTEILHRAAAAQPGRVLEVELEQERRRWIYELEVLDDGGQVWKLRLDARSGELLTRGRDD